MVHLRIEKKLFQLSLMLNVIIFKDVFVPYISVIYILRFVRCLASCFTFIVFLMA